MILGGLSAMLYGGHPYLSVGMFIRKVDMRTVFFATVFMIVLLVLAYLTNPSENSFRHYLTEQSFRQHIKRLDENAQDEEGESQNTGKHISHSRRSLPSTRKPGRDHDTQSPFHFVNRASISLRTPKHAFHSFGVLTIAAVFPSSQGCNVTLGVDAAQSTVNDSWFIGAFGRWWRGGTIRAWWHGALIDQKDAERLNSGILDLKALDSLESYDGHLFSAPAPLDLPAADSSKPLRGTERSTQRALASASRSTTPPPLPKSASLPFHAPRQSATPPKVDRSRSECLSRGGHTLPQALSCGTGDVLKVTPSISYSASSTSLFDQSPVIAEILRQITHSSSAVVELRTQLTDFRATAAQGHAVIQSELDEHRARKRSEDVTRGELKTKTKALEDEKRAAEGGKREAEKRLKAAESKRDSASLRIERLDREIGELEGRIQDDEDAVRRAMEDGDKAESDAAEELEKKRKEIKVAEDVIAALTSRAKELEEKIIQEEERLRKAKEQAELRKQDRSFYPLHGVPTVEEDDTTLWSPTAAYSQSQTHAQDSLPTFPTDIPSGLEIFPPAVQITEAVPMRESKSSGLSPRPKTLSLGGISNFRDRLRPEGINNEAFVRPPFAFLTDQSSAPLSTLSTRFSPFADTDAETAVSSLPGGEAISPRSTSLIPSSLISSLESIPSMEDMSRSFQSDTDDVMDPNWRAHRSLQAPVEHPSALSASPTSITNPSFDGVDQEDPFEVRPPPLSVRRRLASDTLDSPHPMVPPAPSRTISDPESVPKLKTQAHAPDSDDKANSVHRRWNSVDPKERKGLNPEAKVFRLTKKSLPSFFPPQSAPPSGAASFDPVVAKPPGLGLPQIVAPDTDTLFSSSSSINMRAFAPSPAEREALRALGGSTNASLERLPTLSEVSLGSMPSSPSHVNAVAAPLGPEASSRTLLHPGLSWLQSLPRVRKPAFSPWDDEVEEGKSQEKR